MKILVGGILSGFLASAPMLAMPSPVISNTPLLTNLAANGTSDVPAGGTTIGFVVDISHMVNGAVQVCSSDDPTTTVFTVEIRMGPTMPWYVAAQIDGLTTKIPFPCTSLATNGYFTLPVATQLRVEVSSYATGHIYANYGERAF